MVNLSVIKPDKDSDFFLSLHSKFKGYYMRMILNMCLMLCLLCSCGEKAVKEYTVEVVARYPHDTQSYTQGLFFDDGQMYESTGVKGRSTFRKVDISTGNALKRLDFDKKYFLEGSVMFNGNLYILTWESKVAFVYDADSLSTNQPDDILVRDGVSLLTESSL